MSEVFDNQVATQAAEYLAKTDMKLAPVIAKFGPCTIRPHKDYYWELVDAIISQQLSVKAAASIEKRFQDLFSSNVPKPEAILEKSVDELRTAGLSRAKANYIRDLAQHLVDGKLKFDRFDKMSNDEIINELTDVKGIGEWTAHMFLMFCMGRADVLAPGDLGIRSAIKKLYDLKNLPTPEEVKQLAIRKNWHPYETAACWYLWQSLENVPKL
jgi:DNA-3-methyladenine glycosylase II